MNGNYVIHELRKASKNATMEEDTEASAAGFALHESLSNKKPSEYDFLASRFDLPVFKEDKLWPFWSFESSKTQCMSYVKTVENRPQNEALFVPYLNRRIQALLSLLAL
ncbi:hypothetical protein ACTXT7_007442 [Hymenolepis weldensis]